MAEQTDQAKRNRARREYWQLPLDTHRRRAHAWFDSLVIDGRLGGLVLKNRHDLGGDVWRSSQPSPFDLRNFASKGGKAVLSLRGQDCGGSCALERDEAKQLGLELDHWRCWAAKIASVHNIQKLIKKLRTLPPPLLIHCKSGADRMGFVSVIYKHVVLEEPMEEAIKQLSLKYGHLKGSRTGVLDLFFERFMEAQARTGLSFEEWLINDCDPEEIAASFERSPVVGWIEEKILRRE